MVNFKEKICLKAITARKNGNSCVIAIPTECGGIKYNRTFYRESGEIILTPVKPLCATDDPAEQDYPYMPYRCCKCGKLLTQAEAAKVLSTACKPLCKKHAAEYYGTDDDEAAT